MQREAKCSCGSVRALCRGEPARVSVCHCLACKARSGSAFSYNATYPEDQVETFGDPRSYERRNDEGYWGRFAFCGDCGATVHYRIERRPGMITIPIGAFGEPDFPAPTVEVYDERRQHWLPALAANRE